VRTTISNQRLPDHRVEAIRTDEQVRSNGCSIAEMDCELLVLLLKTNTATIEINDFGRQS